MHSEYFFIAQSGKHLRFITTFSQPSRSCVKLSQVFNVLFTFSFLCILCIQDIERINAAVPVERVKLVATDGASRYIRDYLEEMDEETFTKWLSYHFSTCERQDLIGATNHSLDILRKV